MTKALKKFFPVFAGPTLLAFMIAFIVPFFMGLYLSFTKFSILINARFVGTDNYARALGERSDFPQALLFTAVAYIHRPQSRNFQNYQHKNSYRQAEGLASQQ